MFPRIGVPLDIGCAPLLMRKKYTGSDDRANLPLFTPTALRTCSPGLAVPGLPWGQHRDRLPNTLKELRRLRLGISHRFARTNLRNSVGVEERVVVAAWS